MSKEPKTNCPYCGAEFLQVTANRTGGYCMRHARMGLKFEERMGCRIIRGDISDLGTARDEFHQAHSEERWEEFGDILRHHWERFECAVQPRDVIRRFSGQPTGPNPPKLFPEKGFICERGLEIVEGVCCLIGIDPVRALEDRAFLYELRNGSPEMQADLLAEDDVDLIGNCEEFMH